MREIEIVYAEFNIGGKKFYADKKGGYSIKAMGIKQLKLRGLEVTDKKGEKTFFPNIAISFIQYKGKRK